MSYMRVHGYDAGKIMAAANPGDTTSLGQFATILNAAGASTLTAVALAGQILIRQGAGVVNDVTDTAVNIMQAMYGNTGGGPRVGEGFICRFSNWGASTVTITGGVGVTVTGNTAVLTLTTKDLFFVCTSVGVQTFLNGVYTNVGATFTCQCL